MLLLVPTVSRNNLGLKENTLAGALCTLSATWIETGKRNHLHVCVRWIKTASSCMWKIAERICCDGSDVIVERILFIGFFVQT